MYMYMHSMMAVLTALAVFYVWQCSNGFTGIHLKYLPLQTFSTKALPYVRARLYLAHSVGYVKRI